MTLKDRIKYTLILRIYGFFKIPLLAYVRPQIVDVGRERTELKIKLCRRTKNHLNAMYFGALAIGAELVIAMKAVKAIADSGQKIDFLFADFNAKFNKRADGDVHFFCDEGVEVEKIIHDASQSTERINRVFHSYATVPSKDPNVKIAEFTLTLTVKNRSKK